MTAVNVHFSSACTSNTDKSSSRARNGGVIHGSHCHWGSHIRHKELPPQYLRVDSRIPTRYERTLGHTCAYPNDPFSCANMALGAVNDTKSQEGIGFPTGMPNRLPACGECLPVPGPRWAHLCRLIIDLNLHALRLRMVLPSTMIVRFLALVSTSTRSRTQADWAPSSMSMCAVMPHYRQ